MENLVNRLEKLKSFSDNLKRKIENLNDQSGYLESIDEIAKLALENKDAQVKIKVMFEVEYPEAIRENIDPEGGTAQSLLETLCGSQDPESFTKNLGMLRHKIGGGDVGKGQKVNLSKTVRLDNLDNIVFLSILTNVYQEVKKHNTTEQIKIMKIIERQESKLKVE
jgi:hypothetical protein